MKSVIRLNTRFLFTSNWATMVSFYIGWQQKEKKVESARITLESLFTMNKIVVSNFSFCKTTSFICIYPTNAKSLSAININVSWQQGQLVNNFTFLPSVVVNVYSDPDDKESIHILPSKKFYSMVFINCNRAFCIHCCNHIQTLIPHTKI